MAIEPDEDEHEDLTIEGEADQPEPDEIDPPEVDEDEPPGDDPPEDDDEIEITFGDGEQAARVEDSAPIRALREENRRQARELAELRRTSAPKPVELGPKPTMESCEWDEDKFAAETEAWIGRKAKADDEQQQQQQRQQQEQQAWQDDLAKFGRQKTELKVRDFDAAESAFTEGLSQAQQSIVVIAAENSAKLILALGRHPGKLAELAKITNPVKFTAAIVKLEGSLKVTTKRQAPAPDRSVRGSAPFTTANGKVDKHLEKLERAADASGDRTAVVQYKRDLREKANKTPRR